MEHSIIIIGGGPAGYVAAIEAARNGATVTLIEEDKLGGTCLNRGCIPTKALIRTAEVINTVKNSKEFGVNTSGFNVDIDAIQKRKNDVVSKLVSGVETLLQGNNVRVIKGFASFMDYYTLMVKKDDGDTEIISADNIIIATGSSPLIPPIEGADLSSICTSEELLSFKEVPKSITIIGGGVIGMEMATILNALGSKVNVIEFLPRILSNQDSDITKRYTVIAKKSGITINVKTRVTKIEKVEDGYSIIAKGPKGDVSFESEKVMIAVGRKPNIDGLNIDEIGIKHNGKGIIVDYNYQTNIRGIYAIGDVNGLCMLAHAASHQGECVANYIMGIRENMSSMVPACVFVFPEIASVGITEDEAKGQEIPYITSKFMFGANGKALAMGEEQGFIKLIATRHDGVDREDEIIIGAHIMGPHASDLIHECNIFISKRMKIREIKNIIHAHPTLSEVVIEAVNGLIGEAIHSL